MAGAQASIVSTTIIRPGRVRLVRGEGFMTARTIRAWLSRPAARLCPTSIALRACFA